MAYPIILTADQELAFSEESWTTLYDLIVKYYGSDQTILGLCERFQSYYEAIPVCSGKNINWIFSGDSTTLEVKLEFSTVMDSWKIQQLRVSSNAFYEEHQQTVRKNREKNSSYFYLETYQEIESQCLEGDEFFCEIKGVLNNFQYQMDFPEELRDIPFFPAGWRGYARGQMQMGADRVDVWIMPGIEAAKGNRTIQLYHPKIEKVLVVVGAY